MGIEYFFTFVHKNLFSPIDRSNPVKLTGQNVIIDGNSFLHFLYNQISKDDKNKAVDSTCHSNYQSWVRHLCGR